ncbi:hypothetical protein RMSM_01987 [Rhodopirellula maiorica SM1]|uniref:Uncharacterized protein n=1 Tax=Rhodopirellula maiorica SM1 TaxID=1265738 RepID=M5RP47_9BACT|nr:hypothetical protein RMSM_01987 [Rhodopirellula maiorica SM1]
MLLAKLILRFVSVLRRGSVRDLRCGSGDGSNLHMSLTRNDFSLMTVSLRQNRTPMTLIRLCGCLMILLNVWNAEMIG